MNAQRNEQDTALVTAAATVGASKKLPRGLCQAEASTLDNAGLGRLLGAPCVPECGRLDSVRSSALVSGAAIDVSGV